MRDELLHYYERELSFIRKLGVEFADKYPEVAGRLQLEPTGSPDPHVERLIEAFAMLTARVHMRLDDDFAEITDALLGIVYPHYTSPIPSLAIVSLASDPDATYPPDGLRVARHSLLYSKAVGGVRCRFRTAYPVELWPIEVESVELVSAVALGQPVPPDVRSALRIRLRALGGHSFAELAIPRLRFFLDAQPAAAHRLYELLLRDPRGLLAQKGPGKAGQLLPETSVRPVGFARDEGLLVYPEESFLGYRLLQEYFAYPDKFLFVELAGLDALTLERTGDTLDLSVLLSESPAELDLRVSAADLRLGCTPVVNVFEMNVDPIRVTQTAIEYPVIPDVRNARAYEVYSIQSATSVERGTGKATRFEPIYTVRHGAQAGSGGAYWYGARRGSVRKDDAGSDLFISLVDEKWNPLVPPSDVMTLEALCTNRDLPARLAFGDPRGDFEIQGNPAVTRVVSVRNPSEPLRSPVGRSSRWRVISHLALNHLSLTDETGGPERGQRGALDALREILKLYDFADSAVTRQRIAGLVGLRTRRIVRRAGMGAHAGFARGTEVELSFDPDLYAGTGVFLFASVLEAFLGLYAATNSFTETVARTRLREGVLKRWPPRAGEKRLL
ncbi:MAG TPA: type VI secretion system baseplate subunit TssF [Myxococcota bacterium]|nr:type VI secretion system baseplate subunit TssF [Myxococcota bacterium]